MSRSMDATAVHKSLQSRRMLLMRDVQRQMGFISEDLYQDHDNLEPFKTWFKETAALVQSRCLSKSRRLSPSELKLVSEQLFEQVGPLLWPDHLSKRPSWLVEAEVNNHDGLYPVDLYFSVDDHRPKLRELFCRWIEINCKRRRWVGYVVLNDDNATSASQESRRLESAESDNTVHSSDWVSESPGMDTGLVKTTNTATKEPPDSPLTTMSTASGSSYGAFRGTRSSRRKRPHEDDDAEREVSSKHVKTEHAEIDGIGNIPDISEQSESSHGKEVVFIDLTRSSPDYSSVTSGNPKPYSCNACNKRFKTEIGSKLHSLNGSACKSHARRSGQNKTQTPLTLSESPSPRSLMAVLQVKSARLATLRKSCEEGIVPKEGSCDLSRGLNDEEVLASPRSACLTRELPHDGEEDSVRELGQGTEVLNSSLRQHNPEQDNWIFDCAICNRRGSNIDDGGHHIACDRCNTWQHSKCHGLTPRQAEQECIEFVCPRCIPQSGKDPNVAEAADEIVESPPSAAAEAVPQEIENQLDIEMGDTELFDASNALNSTSQDESVPTAPPSESQAPLSNEAPAVTDSHCAIQDTQPALAIAGFQGQAASSDGASIIISADAMKSGAIYNQDREKKSCEAQESDLEMTLQQERLSLCRAIFGTQTSALVADETLREADESQHVRPDSDENRLENNAVMLQAGTGDFLPNAEDNLLIGSKQTTTGNPAPSSAVEPTEDNESSHIPITEAMDRVEERADCSLEEPMSLVDATGPEGLSVTTSPPVAPPDSSSNSMEDPITAVKVEHTDDGLQDILNNELQPTHQIPRQPVSLSNEAQPAMSEPVAAQERSSMDGPHDPEDNFSEYYDRAQIQIDWGIETDVDDYLTLEQPGSVEDFFQSIEAIMPLEVAEAGREISELRFKSVTPGTSGLNRRVVRSHRGRSALLGFLNRLKALCEEDDIELRMEVGWT